MHSFSLFGMTLASSRSFIDRFPMYLDDLAVPIGTIIAALAVGILIERLALRFLYRFFEKRSIAIGRRLIRSLNGIITLWFGLGAFYAVVEDLPLAPTALPGVLHVASALLMLTFAVLVSRVVIALIRSFASHHERALPSISLFENIVRAVIYSVGLLAILRIFGVAVTPLLTALGVGGLAVALALQETLGNFFAGVYIIASTNIDPGDTVRLDSGQEGVIADITWRVTTLRTPSNTLVIVPNAKFAASIVTNYDHPDRRQTLVVDLPIDPGAAGDGARALELRDRALAVARTLATEQPNVILSAPTVDFSSITVSGPVLSVVFSVSDHSRSAELRSLFLERLIASGPYPFAMHGGHVTARPATTA